VWVSTVAPVVVSTDQVKAVNNFTALVGAPIAEFPIPASPLSVVVFSGVSLISGTPDALGPVRDLRATFFVDSLTEMETLLNRFGWTRVGSLGEASLLARDTDGNLLEFVEGRDNP
jgi:hypothetical protein